MQLPVAVSIVIVVKSNHRYLMVEEDRGGETGAVWYFPSGALEKDESLAEAARREVREETGYDVEPVAVIAIDHGAFRKPSGLLWWRFAISARLMSDERQAVDEPDILTVDWFDTDQLAGLQLRRRDVPGLIERLSSGHGLLLDACNVFEDGKLEGFFH